MLRDQSQAKVAFLVKLLGFCLVGFVLFSIEKPHTTVLYREEIKINEFLHIGSVQNPVLPLGCLFSHLCSRNTPTENILLYVK